MRGRESRQVRLPFTHLLRAFFQFSRSIIGLQEVVFLCIAVRGGWVKAKFYMYIRYRLVFLRFKTNKPRSCRRNILSKMEVKKGRGL